MELKALSLSSSYSSCPLPTGLQSNASVRTRSVRVAVRASAEKGEKGQTKSKQSLFGNVMEALDFAQVRSSADAELIEDAREATGGGGRMTREQYGALRRKIGGTYKDFFKSYVEVEGEYVEQGWVDKTCKICKRETSGEPRQVDNFGRYVHVACLEERSKSKPTNFFSRLFSN